MKRAVFLVLAMVLTLSSNIHAAGNTSNESFTSAKKMLEKVVYKDHRITLYCGARFDAARNVVLPEGFATPHDGRRVHRMDWEHVVPAENFGRAFLQWREGDGRCVDGQGRRYKGRKCAEKASAEYRFMQADMYNLFPAIGIVNAMRSNRPFQMLGDSVPSAFGSCAMKIQGRRAEPPARARGQIARATKYMAEAYGPRFTLSHQQQQLMDAWDRMYPVDTWECVRARRIEALQGNENRFVKEPCQQAGLW